MIELLAAAAIQATTLPCLHAGDRIRGELRYVETRHPNGTPMSSPFIVMVEPRCIDDPDLGHVEGRWVQVGGGASQEMQNIPPGSQVTIEVRDFVVPHTAWHFGDFVANDARVVGFELQ